MSDNNRQRVASVSNNHTVISRRNCLRLAGAAGVLGLAGCVGGNESGADSSSGDESSSGGGSTGSTDQSTGEPAKPNSLTVRTYGGVWADSLKEAARGFKDETGIKVDYTTQDTRSVDNKVIQSAKQERTPPVDVQWTIPTWSFRVHKSGATSKLNPEVAPNVENLATHTLPDEVPGNWPYVPIFINSYALSYNNELVTSPPESWNEIWKDEYKSSVGMYSTGSGFIPVVAELLGVELQEEMPEVFDKIAELGPNVGVAGSDQQITSSLRTEDITFGCYLTPNGAIAKQKGAPIDYTWPKEGLVVKTNDVYVPAGLSNSKDYWAKRYVNHIISAEGQSRWATSLPVVPMNKQAEYPDYMKNNEVFPTTDEERGAGISVPPSKVGKWVGTWSEEFSKAIGN